MRIQIPCRLRPYSHLPGTYCLIPGTFFRVQVFPSLVRIHDLQGLYPRLVSEIPLEVSGPVQGFTVQQDLERNLVRVWADTPTGYMRYRITVPDGTPILTGEKLPPGVSLPESSPLSTSSGNGERLLLGVDKAQDWPMVMRRNLAEEIFPFWYSLGSKTPCQDLKSRKGTAFLLDACSAAMNSGAPETIIAPFMNLYSAGFEGILSPRLNDEDHQGFSLPPLEPGDVLSPLILLKEGAKLIRSLFIRVEDKSVALLPSLPTDFHCGRFIHLAIPGVGVLDMEWSKKTLRRCLLRAETNTVIQFELPRELKQFRVRAGHKDRGHILSSSSPIEIAENQEFFFDNFQK
jgi:hypothetical protein